MDYVIDVDVPVAVMYRGFTTVGYWEELVEFYRENSFRTEIKHFSSDDGGTDISFDHILSAPDLPPIARAVVPGTFIITREQHFEPFQAASKRATGRYNALVPAAPVEITGQYVLSENGAVSQMSLKTFCKVNVPLIGGQIEQLVVNGLKSLFAKEGEFTADWITRHH